MSDAHRRERPRDPERGQPPVRSARLRLLARVPRPARSTLQGRTRTGRLPRQSRRRPPRYQRLGRVADGAQDPRPAGPRLAPCRHPPGAGQRHPLPGHLAAAVRRRCHRRRSFHRERGGDVTAPFMHVTGRFGYAEDGDVQILALPYKGGALEMVLILPAEGTSLSSVEAGLDAGKFAGWLAAPAPARVAVGLPRLHLETAFDLAGTLAALGMPTAFTAAADFSGLTTGGEPLNIDKVVHKAYLDVDEKGTEAAAATAVTMEVTSARPVEQLKVFTADRPFILAIRHRASGAVLFLGRVADPS
ncbi:MAG: hypothetical protein IPI48_11085 [bacterium]|nr:hypothetical protein [bacterium]